MYIYTITIDTNIGAEIGWNFCLFVANNQFKIELRKWIVKHAAAKKIGKN